MKEAIIIEDIVTLRYIQKHGAENVKGGRYLGSDRKRVKQAKSHLERGFIHMFHKLYEDYKIVVSELEDLSIFDYVNDFENSPHINSTLAWAKMERKNKQYFFVTGRYSNQLNYQTNDFVLIFFKTLTTARFKSCYIFK